MNTILASLIWEFRLQFRYYFWLSGLVVTLVWLLLLLAVSEEAKVIWVPVLIFADIGNIGLLFIAGILYLERRQGTLYVSATLPVPPAHWLSLKLAGLTALCTVCGLAIVFFTDTTVDWWRIIPAAILSGALFTSIGFLLALQFERIMDYFLGMMPVLTLLNLPILHHLGILSSELMWLVPSHAVLQLLAGSFQDMPAARYVMALLVALAWTALCHWLGVRNLQRAIALRPQA